MIEFIKGFPGYAVSDRGDVYSIKLGRLKELTKHLCTSKERRYYCVNLIVDGHKVIKRIHELMAETFLEKPSDAHVVNFKDNNPNNLRLSNLEYVTRTEQAENSIKRGTFVATNRRGHSPIGIERATAIYHEYAAGGITIRALAKKHGTNETTVSGIIAGRRYPDAKLL